MGGPGDTTDTTAAAATTNRGGHPPGRGRARLGLGLAVVAAVAAVVTVVAGCSGDDGDDSAGDAVDTVDAGAEWSRLGYDLGNTRAAPEGAAPDAAAVPDLAPAWELRGVDGVTGTPVVSDGTVFVGDWTGRVRALDAAGGDERWAHDLDSGYVGGSVAVDGGRVVVGTFDARIVALDRDTGEPLWETPVDDHPKAVVFGSPVVVDGLVVVGVGSFEVFAPGDPSTFRGSVVALDVETGAEQWRFWMTAGDATEGPGVSVWSSPAVDTDRGVVYIGTGQAYALPAPPRSDALVALDLHTGEEVWSTQFTAGDVWTIAAPTGLDADVGAVPNLFEADGVAAVGVGDKAGVYRALDRETGEILWERPLTAGGAQGGVMASAAVADGTVFVASNDASQSADLVALGADTGDELWRVGVGAHVTGPVTWAGGVLYLADDSGRIAAYDAGDGTRLWAHEVPFPAAGGISVADGTVYAGWGWWLAGRPDDADGGLIAFRPAGGDDGDSGDGDGGDGQGGDGDEAGAPSGEDVYRESCASCHGGDGQGGSGPPMVGVDERLTRDQHVEVVREGRAGMPAWEDELTPEEIEAVVDYERTVLAAGD